MIDLNELKPIIEPLKLSADVIEAIQSIDKDVKDDSAEITRLNGEISRMNDEWNERFRAAFFKGDGIPHDHEAEVTEQVDEQSGDEKPLATTYDELFGEEEM